MCASAWREFDELLIHKVEELPCLYNYRLKDFRNHLVKQCAWRKIAGELGIEENQCQRRWRLIRDTYVRYKKAQECAAGLTFVKKEDNPLMCALSFLDVFVKHRSLKTETLSDELNYVAECDEGFSQEQPGVVFTGDSDNDNESSASNPAQFSTFLDSNLPATCKQDFFRPIKRERDESTPVRDRVLLSALISDDGPRIDNELECFVKSVSGTLHRFTPKQRAVAKVRIQQLLLEVEFGEESSVSLLDPRAAT